MKAIWKFAVPMQDRLEVMMPEGAEILTAAMQFDSLCLWALVETPNKMTPRSIAIYGTGHEITVPGRYIATFQLDRGALVFHVFEV